MAAEKPTAAWLSHPFLQSSTLFLGSLPNYVLEEQITRVFESFYPTPALTFVRTKNGRNRGALRVGVEFIDIETGA